MYKYVLKYYADDLILISEKPSGLQHCLNALEVYCKEWGLNINTKKTQIMIFSKIDYSQTEFLIGIQSRPFYLFELNFEMHY
jgi:hypothetical protein